MAKEFTSLLVGKENIVLLGEAGCGKSEIALNLAALTAGEREVHFFDMDQTKPLYRSRDAAKVMRREGVKFHYEEQFYDAPTLVGGVAESLADPNRLCILDVGGNDTGARLIGGFSKLLERENTAVFYVVNPFRPWSRAVDAIDGTLSSILRVSHLKSFNIISNPNLGHETSLGEFAEGIEKTKQLLEEYVPVVGACAGEEIFAQACQITDLPLLKLHLYLTYEWNNN